MSTGDEQCCANTCLDTDISCCPDGNYYCSDPSRVCEPCPEGQICYDTEGDANPWQCCPSDGSSCASSGSGSPTIAAPAAPSSSSPPSPSPTALSSSSSPAALPSSSSPASLTLSLSPAALLSSSTLTVLPPSLSSAVLLSSLSPSTPAYSLSPTIPSSSPSVSIVVITSANTASFIPSATSSSSYSPIPTWNGSGPLLVGSCATPEYSLVCGPQTTAAYFIGIVGCVGSKTDCCPYQVPSTPTTAAATTSETETLSETAIVPETVGPSITNQCDFPTAAVPSLVTLPRCPEDYVTISSVCCPS